MANAGRWYQPASIWGSLRLRPHVYLAAVAGLAAFLLCPHDWPGTVRVLTGWDVAGLVYLGMTFRLMYRCGTEHMQKAAAVQDDSRLVVLTVILLSIGASFVAIAQLIGHAKEPSIQGAEKTLLIGIAVLTIIISWSVTQTAFALHYAHEFYRPGPNSDAAAGLLFPECKAPDYWDFLYFSTSIGAASQTSDISIRSQSLRRLVTLHAVIAFFFNTAVLALTVNIAASLA